MSERLRRRLDRIERARPNDAPAPIIVVRSINGDGSLPPITGARIGERGWKREPGESEDAFEARMVAEAVRTGHVGIEMDDDGLNLVVDCLPG